MKGLRIITLFLSIAALIAAIAAYREGKLEV